MSSRNLVLIAASLCVAALAAATETGAGDGIAVCACGKDPLTGATIPHIATTQVTITQAGGGTINAGGQNTGLSGGAFTGQSIPKGKCKYVRYAFECSKTESGNWTCWVTSFTLAERDEDPKKDCP